MPQLLLSDLDVHFSSAPGTPAFANHPGTQLARLAARVSAASSFSSLCVLERVCGIVPSDLKAACGCCSSTSLRGRKLGIGFDDSGLRLNENARENPPLIPASEDSRLCVAVELSMAKDRRGVVSWLTREGGNLLSCSGGGGSVLLTSFSRTFSNPWVCRRRPMISLIYKPKALFDSFRCRISA